MKLFGVQITKKEFLQWVKLPLIFLIIGVVVQQTFFQTNVNNISLTNSSSSIAIVNSPNTIAIVNNGMIPEMQRDYLNCKNNISVLGNITEQLKVCQNLNKSDEPCQENNTIVPAKYGMGITITKCSPVLSQQFKGLSSEVTLDMMVIPFQSQSNPRYILDIGRNLEQDRASVFLENGYLKFNVKSSDDSEAIVKKSTSALYMKPDTEYGITARISNQSIKLFVFEYGVAGVNLVWEGEQAIGSKFDLNNSYFVIGGDLNDQNHFDGVFDEVWISSDAKSDDWIKASHLQTYTIGPIQYIGNRTE